MDAGSYKSRKEKQSVELVRLGPGYFQTIVKMYDPESGLELEPEVLQVNHEALKQQEKDVEADIAERQKALDGLREFIADVEAIAVGAGDDLAALALARKRPRGPR